MVWITSNGCMDSIKVLYGLVDVNSIIEVFVLSMIPYKIFYDVDYSMEVFYAADAAATRTIFLILGALVDRN
ncbi:hypothetical protein CEXT_129271 [Caerostris extrusa]|uniref:Uncharacterized protein n=1 Tax=Caerostris extrusa TaxID=172846 RepID=A0AAV4UI86_CAEEX|nr:hypothetical protein CEXT_129271 [Caerostris extrusa]